MAKDQTVRITTDKRWLPVELSEKEIAERGGSLSQLMKEVDELELEKEASGKVFKEKISAINGRISKLAESIRDGKECKNVTVEIVTNYSAGTYAVTRTDTMEVLESRRLTSDECQRKLPLKDSDKKDGWEKGAKRSDEKPEGKVVGKIEPKARKRKDIDDDDTDQDETETAEVKDETTTAELETDPEPSPAAPAKKKSKPKKK